MNWQLNTADKLTDAELEVARGENDKPDIDPDPALVKAARKAAADIAGALGKSADHHIEVRGHETTRGRGFRPGHVTISVSRLDPKR